MEIRNKKIDFKETLHYFLKDKDSYNRSDCHINTYNVFYENNHKVIDVRQSNFYFVTGIVIFSDGQNKYCVVHSWVEDCGKVIDVTSLANSILYQLNNPSDEQIEEIKNILEQNVEYVGYSRINNKKLTNDWRKIQRKCFNNIDKTFSEIEKYLQDIVKRVSDDIEFINEVKEIFKCEFKEDNFAIEIK